MDAFKFQVNSFQLVIATDGTDSFAVFIYDDLQWLKGQGKFNESDVPGQAGFDAGDGQNWFLLPHSGTNQVQNLARYHILNKN